VSANRGDGLGAIYDEIRAVATRLDKALPGSGDGLRDEAEAALRAVMAARRTSTTTTGRQRRSDPPYARRGARG
jgi:hypothetical protein